VTDLVRIVAGVDLDEAKQFGDPSASPCIGSCGRNRCAACAAEYTMREACHV
jgi:hypothetical protein